jgi:hypothetical protein
MTVTAAALINAKYASDSDNTEYTSPASTRTIIDKFTATNTDSGSQTITVNLVPSGGSVGASNIVTSALSIAAGASVDLPEMKNHVLEAGDFISAKASVASKVVIRASGRKVT